MDLYTNIHIKVFKTNVAAVCAPKIYINLLFYEDFVCLS